MGRRKIRDKPSLQKIPAKDFRLADEIRYIQHRAATYDARFVIIGPIALFSTNTGDAWLLDPADHLAARVARDGTPEPIDFEETETQFFIRWKGSYSVDGDAFVFVENDSARIVAILGYPAGRIARLG